MFDEHVLGSVLDVFRLRQYFNVVVRGRDVVAGLRDDAGFLDDMRRAGAHLAASVRAPARA